MQRNLTLAFILLASAVPALAQPPASPQNGAPSAMHPLATPDVKAARRAMRQACTADVKALCSDVVTGGGKVMQCLKAHAPQLSDGCKSAAQSLRAARKGA